MRNRTSRGTPLRSTAGMRFIKDQPRWILVADRHRLVLFETCKDELGECLLMKEEFLDPDGRKKGHELVSDRPGRAFDSQDKSRRGQAGGARHAYGNSAGPVERATQSLVHAAVQIVDKHGLNREGTHLTVLAEPRLAGNLIPALQRAVPHCATGLLEKDYAWIPTRDLAERLKTVLG